ncbi:MAG: hypothetical protein AAF602_13940, partial [Myxococcota bacterium]
MFDSVVWHVARFGWLRVGASLSVLALTHGVVLLMAVVQLDAIVDWSATWSIVAETPVWWRGLALAALVAGQGLGERRVVRRLWLEPHGLLLRQPLGPVDLGAPALLLLGLVVTPLAAIGGLATGSWVTTVVWGLLGALGVAAWAGPRSALGLPVTLLVGGAATVAELHGALAGLVVGAALVLGIPALGHASRRWAVEASEAPGIQLPQPRSPILALLHRDLLILGREGPRHLLGPLSLGAALAVVVGLMRRNNAEPEGLVAGAGLVGLGLASWSAHGAVTAVVHRLGAAFDPPHWPLRARVRVAALIGLSAGLIAPSWAVAAVGGLPVLGPGDQLGQLAAWWG